MAEPSRVQSGLMMVQQLSTISILKHASFAFPDREVVSRGYDGEIERLPYSLAYRRVAQLANTLQAMGIRAGDRVGTVAWSNTRHFELFYGITGIGAICHKVNPRFSRQQVIDVINQAEDRILFVDPGFVDLIEGIRQELQTVKRVIVLAKAGEQGGEPTYDALISGFDDTFKWPNFDENAAAFLVFTSGTTSAPKGVMYSHRSVVLHAMANLASGVKPQRYESCVMPLASMFHVTAWGHPFLCPMVGSKLVLPGPKLDAVSCYELIEAEGVTLAFGVPTLWARILEHVEEQGGGFSTLQAVACGGAPAPRAMIRQFGEQFGVEFISGWGMTEVSPTGAAGNKVIGEPKDDSEQYWAARRKNRVVFGIEMKLIDEAGNTVPNNGESTGELLVRGNWVAARYFGDDSISEGRFTDDGWMRTGDVATIDRHGRMEIVDRIKDLIKSGGEWISSLELENAALQHPAVAEAAAIAVPDPKWIERPLLVVRLQDGVEAQDCEIKDLMEQSLDQKWKVPDRIEFVDELPQTSTGKVAKTELRKRFGAADKP